MRLSVLMRALANQINQIRALPASGLQDAIIDSPVTVSELRFRRADRELTPPNNRRRDRLRVLRNSAARHRSIGSSNCLVFRWFINHPDSQLRLRSRSQPLLLNGV